MAIRLAGPVRGGVTCRPGANHPGADRMRLGWVGAVSLLDFGPDVITVRPEIETTDFYGNPVRVPGAPVQVRCRVQPLSTSDSAAVPNSVGSTYRVIARDLPGGSWSIVTWQGRDWDIIGERQLSNGSGMTRHCKFLITSRVPEVV